MRFQAAGRKNFGAHPFRIFLREGWAFPVRHRIESSRFSANHSVSSLNNVYLTVLVKLVGAAGLGGGGGGGVVPEA